MRSITIVIAILLLASVSFADTSIDVELRGSFKKTGHFTLPEGSMLSALVRKGRGFLDTADLNGGYILRKDNADERYKLNKLRADIKTSLYDNLDTKGTFDYKGALSNRQKTFLALLESIDESFRLPVVIEHFRFLKGSENDISLEDGDVLVLPEKSDAVTVYGCVEHSGKYPYKSTSYGSYLRAAGGSSGCADTEYVYIISAGGDVRRIDNTTFSWSEANKRWEMNLFTRDTYIHNGETLVVPFATDDKWLSEVSDLNNRLINMLAITDPSVYQAMSEIFSK